MHAQRIKQANRFPHLQSPGRKPHTCHRHCTPVQILSLSCYSAVRKVPEAFYQNEDLWAGAEAQPSPRSCSERPEFTDTRAKSWQDATLMNPSEVLASGRKRPRLHHFRLVLSRLHENRRLTLQAATEERCHLSATLKRLLPACQFWASRHNSLWITLLRWTDRLWNTASQSCMTNKSFWLAESILIHKKRPLFLRAFGEGSTGISIQSCMRHRRASPTRCTYSK